MEENGKIIVALEKAELEHMLKEAAEIGAKVGGEKYEEELKRYRNKRTDRRYHNTKLLLRNYRNLNVNAEDSVFGRSQMEESAADILTSMMNMYNSEVVVESIMRSATRTAIIVSHVKKMLELYQIYCERSSNPIEIRRYNVVYDLYIAKTKLDRKDIAEKYNISKETTYKDEKAAIEALSALIFGIDGVNFR